MNSTQIFFQSLPFNPYHSLVLMNLTFKKKIFKTELRCAITYPVIITLVNFSYQMFTGQRPSNR